jgi:exodeoxyribonuclease VII small subunit
MPKKATAGFEEQLDRLQKITEDLERGELSLEESLVLYKEGVELSRRCRQALEEARHTVKIYAEEGLRDFNDSAEPAGNNE